MTLAVANAYHHAERLIELLVDEGPLNGRECCARLGWSRGRFDSALSYARSELCPTYELTIPHPTPDEGWLYRVTAEWEPIEAGASHALGMVEARLRSIHRDVKTVKPMLDPRSRAGRRANFLDKHLSHLLGTLKEISDG